MGQNVQRPVSILSLWRPALGQPQARVVALPQRVSGAGSGSGGAALARPPVSAGAPLTRALRGRAAAVALPSGVGTFCAGTSKCK